MALLLASHETTPTNLRYSSCGAVQIYRYHALALGNSIFSQSADHRLKLATLQSLLPHRPRPPLAGYHGEGEPPAAAAAAMEELRLHRLAAEILPLQLLQEGVQVGAGPRGAHERPQEGQGQAQGRLVSSSGRS